MKTLIITITGESGTGKSTLADYLVEKYNIPLVKSYTDRHKRNDEDTGHIFMSRQKMSKILKAPDMMVDTEIAGHRYASLERDLVAQNIYVIDESGLRKLRGKYREKFDIIAVRLIRDAFVRVKLIDKERFLRDTGTFNMPMHCFDIVVENNGSVDEMCENVIKSLEPMVASLKNENSETIVAEPARLSQQ